MENLIKRINAVIAILRDIEKTQTKPTTGIGPPRPPKKEPMLVEKKKIVDRDNHWKIDP